MNVVVRGKRGSMDKEKDKGLLPASTKVKHKKVVTKKDVNKDEEMCTLPPDIHNRLQKMFSKIEKEFERLHNENVSLNEKLSDLSEKYDSLITGSEKLDKGECMASDSPDGNSSQPKNAKKPSASQLMSKKLKTTYKVSTSRIVSSFKMPNNQGGNMYSRLVQRYIGHKDGIWEVSCALSLPQPVLGSASADHTARIWNVESGQCLISYTGHSGSVNSIRFHPSEMLTCTGSGDGSCHIWRMQIPTTSDGRSKSPPTQESPLGSGDEAEEEEGDNQQIIKIKTPLVFLHGHEGPVVSADWWANGSQVVTASWDRTVKLWDVETRASLHMFEGHELEITHASAHSVQKLIVTSSQDTTFRLWDFRLPSMHSVNVFQGHTDSVTSAVFTTRADHVVSGSDDRTVKVWDLKNMRSPLATVRLDSAVNRLSLSPTHNIMAIPLDNRHVRLYEMLGTRMSRLPRRARQGHQRIVCSTCWYDDSNTKPIQLVTSGFDKQLLAWSVNIDSSQ